jgi:haloacetate dehalogenase
VQRLVLLDIAPTVDMYQSTDMRFASAYYHWFFLIQPAPHPERMIGADPGHFLHWKLGGWGSMGQHFYEPQALAEYEASLRQPETIHALCEDYRASAGIDLEHDLQSRAEGRRIECETLVLWGRRGVVHALFDPLPLWQAQCSAAVRGEALDSGHYMVEEAPQEVAARLLEFFAAAAT